MELIKKTWIYLIFLIAILTLGFFSINNRIVIQSQQQHFNNTLLALHKQIEAQLESITLPQQIAVIDNQTTQDPNSTHSETNPLQYISQQLENTQRQLSQLTIIQEQLQQKSLQQERELATLMQEMGTITNQTNENTVSVQQTQQEQYEEEKHVTKIMNNLENYWQNDTIVGAESTLTETKLRDSLHQTEGTSIMNIGCKSNVCKLELQQTVEAMLADNTSFDEIVSDSTIFTRSYPNPDGSQRTVMYLTQGQTSFPDKLFE